MKMTALRWFAFFLLLAAPVGFAADKKSKASGSPTATPEDRVPFHGAIVTFQAFTGTFTLRGKKGPAAYVVSDATKMTKGTADATLDDLAAGVYVRGSARRAPDGRFNALTVKIEPKMTSPMRVEKAIKVAPSPAP